MSQPTESTIKLTSLPVPPGFNCIKEGTASVLVPNGNQVFYNEVQEFNRDLSILVISQYSTNTMKQKNEQALAWMCRRAAEEEKKKGSTENAIVSENGAKKLKTNDDVNITIENSTMSDDVISTTTDTTDATTTTTTTNDNLVSLTNQACGQSNIPRRFAYKGLHIFEALSASGIRSIRYHNEIPYVNTIHVNDMDTQAVESIHRNLLYNQISMNEVIPNKNEATAALYANRAVTRDLIFKLGCPPTPNLPQRPEGMNENDPLSFLYKPTSIDAKSIGKDACLDLPLWNVVDLDPYGSASPFIDAAIQAVADGGLLCVTCTDSAVLCGNYPETGFGKYNAAPLHTYYGKEFGLRMLLHTIESTATRYGRHIVPLVSFSVDFYMRVFFTVHNSQAAVKFSGSKHSMVFHCTGCRSHFTQPVMETTPDWDDFTLGKNMKAKYSVGFQKHDATCRICGSNLRVGGPVWNRPLHDKNFVKQLLVTMEQRQQQYGTRDQTLEQEKLQEEIKKIDESMMEEKQEETKVEEEEVTTTTITTEDVTTTPTEEKKKTNNNNNNKKNKKDESGTILTVQDVLNAEPLPPVKQQVKFGTYQRLKGMLNMAYKELNTMFYYDIPSIAQVTLTSVPKFEMLQAAYVNAGYEVSESHCGESILKTNAEPEFLFDVIRAYAVKEGGNGKPWTSLTPTPRSWVANGNVFDEKEEALTYTEEEEAQRVAFDTEKKSLQNVFPAVIVDTTGMTEKQAASAQSQASIPDLTIDDLKDRHVFFEKLNAGRKIPFNHQQLLAQYLLSRPISSKISFKPYKRDKTKLFFETPAYWGPKAAGGTFSNKHFDELTAQQTDVDNPQDVAKNISRALAFAQQQKALENQNWRRKRGREAAGLASTPKKGGEEQQQQEEEGEGKEEVKVTEQVPVVAIEEKKE